MVMIVTVTKRLMRMMVKMVMTTLMFMTTLMRMIWSTSSRSVSTLQEI